MFWDQVDCLGCVSNASIKLSMLIELPPRSHERRLSQPRASGGAASSRKAKLYVLATAFRIRQEFYNPASFPNEMSGFRLINNGGIGDIGFKPCLGGLGIE